MILIYKKTPAKQIRKEAKDAKKRIAAWFEANPKRKVCNAEVWYGKMVTIHPKTIDADIDAAMNEAIGDKK